MLSPFALRVLGPVAATALLLTACGSDDASVSSPNDGPGIAVGEPNGPGDAAGGTRPADQEMSPEERAEQLFGKTQQEAEFLATEFGWSLRVGRSGDQVFVLTEDYNIDRITIELDPTNPGDEPTVTKVVIELEGGPQTFTP